MTGIETFIAVISAMGGWAAIQYLLDWLRTRKSSKSKDNSDSFNNEFAIYKTQIEFLNTQITTFQAQIIERDCKIEALNTKVEELQKTINALFNENQEIKKKLNDNSCLKFDCKSREKI